MQERAWHSPLPFHLCLYLCFSLVMGILLFDKEGINYGIYYWAARGIAWGKSFLEGAFLFLNGSLTFTAKYQAGRGEKQMGKWFPERRKKELLFIFTHKNILRCAWEQPNKSREVEASQVTVMCLGQSWGSLSHVILKQRRGNSSLRRFLLYFPSRSPSSSTGNCRKGRCLCRNSSVLVVG